MSPLEQPVGFNTATFAQPKSRFRPLYLSANEKEQDLELYQLDLEAGTVTTQDKNGKSIKLSIDLLPENLKNAILDAEKVAVDGLAKVIDDNLSDEFVDLTPWVYLDQIENHEIVELSLQKP